MVAKERPVARAAQPDLAVGAAAKGARLPPEDSSVAAESWGSADLFEPRARDADYANLHLRCFLSRTFFKRERTRSGLDYRQHSGGV